MRATLLIVEDNELNRDLLVQIFEDAYDIELAEDGWNAVIATATTRPDLILMDVELPRMGGLDAVRAIRRLRLKADRRRAARGARGPADRAKLGSRPRQSCR